VKRTLSHTSQALLSIMLGVIALVLVGAGCGRPVPAGSLVVTQLPIAAVTPGAARDVLDQRYPAGSRVVLVSDPSDVQRVRVLSKGLVAAGNPVLSACGEWMLFSGKADATAEWQIYETRLKAGKPRQVTTMIGGAMDAAYLPDGRFVFSSPVPAVGNSVGGFAGGAGTPDIYAQSMGGGEPERLTFGLAGAMSSTVLADGRILFASGGSAAMTVTNQSLFTINNDGTELTGYAGQHDGVARIWHLRETPDGRVTFLSADWESAPVEGRAEQVFTARPYSSRAPVLAAVSGLIRSIEPGDNGQFWVTARRSSSVGEGEDRYAVFQISDASTGLDGPWFDDPDWHDVEAVAVARRDMPMGRISTVKPDESTGQFLCLDANDSSYVDSEGAVPQAARIRLLIASEENEVQPLGVVPVLADGSFLVEVPVNRAIGFEALDEEGRVLRRLAPTVWVRPGENRACVGCHEPHNMAPENRRPLAVKERMVPLTALLDSVLQPGGQP
jgi:hypothetical protein